MSNFFNYDNGIMSTVARVADTITLGVLWVLCSVPIFTVGAASAAFYYAYNRCIRMKMDYAWKTFFAAFKSNFKQATQIWLIVLGMILVIVADCYLLSFMQNAHFLISLIQAAIIVLTLFSVIWMLYLFPYLSRFDVPNKAVMKNCALIALANMPLSLLLLVLFAVCAVGFVFVPLLNLFIPSLYIVFANKMLEKIFRKYMRPKDLEAQLLTRENNVQD